MAFKEEENILSSAFQSILQAFSMQSNTYDREIERYENIISSLQTQNQILQEDNAKLKEEKMHIVQENDQLKSKVDGLVSSLNNKQSKIQLIKQSLGDEHQFDHDYFHNNIRLKKTHNDNYMNHSYITEQHNTSINYINNSTNQSHNSIHKDIDFSQKKSKYNNIEQRLNKLKKNAIPHQYYQKNDAFDNKNVSFYKDEYKMNPTKSKQYELSNKFLSECRIALAPSIFDRMTIVFQDFREGKMSDKDVKTEVKDLLKNNTRLLNLFNIVFETN